MDRLGKFLTCWYNLGYFRIDWVVLGNLETVWDHIGFNGDRYGHIGTALQTILIIDFLVVYTTFFKF